MGCVAMRSVGCTTSACCDTGLNSLVRGAASFIASSRVGLNHLKWSAGDVIGCGVDYVTDRVFFTKNGKFLGETAQSCIWGI